MLKTAALVGGLAYVNRKYFYKRAKRALWRNRNSVYNVGAVGAATLAQKLMAKRTYGQYTPSNSPARKRIKRKVLNQITKSDLFKARTKQARRAEMFKKWKAGDVAGVRKMLTARGRKAFSKKSKPAYEVTGMYGGRFRKANRVGVKSTMDRYNKYGVVHITETTGSVSDANCVYIMNEVMNSADVIKYMCAAMLRKLIEGAGMRVNGMDRCPFDRDAGAANEVNYNISQVTINQTTGAAVTNTKSVLPADTFNDIVSFFVPLWEVYCSGNITGTAANTDEFHKMNLWYGNESPIILNELLFNETFIEVYGYTEMKLQNRTLATGGSQDAENINNNPLQGRSYVFKGVPKPKGNSYVRGGTNSATVFFERIQYPRGLSTFGGSSSAFSPDFREPPLPKQFWNCYKGSYIRLEPGQIKKMVNKGYKKGNILHLLKKIRLQLSPPPVTSTYSIFPVQMVALEDVINANAAENINVQYEVERILGVVCTKRQKKYFTSYYEQRLI